MLLFLGVGRGDRELADGNEVLGYPHVLILVRFAVTRGGEATPCVFSRLFLASVDFQKRNRDAHFLLGQQLVNESLRWEYHSLPGSEIRIPRRAPISLSAPEADSGIVIPWIAPFPWLDCQPEAVSGCAGAGEAAGGKDLPPVLWFQAVPFVFLEDESALAGWGRFLSARLLSLCILSPVRHIELAARFCVCGKK